MDLEHDDRASLWHPGQHHGGRPDGQPADVEAAGRRVQLVNHGAAHPEGHQPAAGTHCTHRGEGGQVRQEEWRLQTAARPLLATTHLAASGKSGSPATASHT